jgi:glycosyltransferase involved in cell wall biosynthesis
MVSALIPSKRVAEGIQAVARVPDAYLVVAGDGPERQKLSQMAQRLLPNRHLLLGSISNEHMPALFRRAAAFLHMSRIEPFGIVYLEAAATGLPIVAPDIETPKWILGDTAFFADPSDTASVADAIREALDPGAGPNRGMAARRRVLADWTWELQAARYRDFILELLGRSPEEPPSKETDRDLDHHRELQHS